LPDCWLEVSMHPEGPATGHLDTGFLGFPLSLSKCWDGSQVPSCYCGLLMQPSRLKLIEIKLICCQNHQIICPNCALNHRLRKSKSRGPCLKPLLPDCVCGEGAGGSVWTSEGVRTSSTQRKGEKCLHNSGQRKPNGLVTNSWEDNIKGVGYILNTQGGMYGLN
jgi:hypothetical protein